MSINETFSFTQNYTNLTATNATLANTVYTNMTANNLLASIYNSRIKECMLKILIRRWY